MAKLAQTPPMGWNTWNTFCWNIDEALIRETADIMASEGYLDAGYDTLVLDDAWMARQRDSDGNLTADPVKFPGGMKNLIDYVHSKGLKFGLYSDSGTQTCAGFPGSFGNERRDANLFASWGVDFLKYDGCYMTPGSNAEVLYRRMGQALRESGRDILYSACYSADGVWTWMKKTGAHMWRIAGDIADSWESIEKVGFGAVGIGSYSGPGGWNDLDMLVVGVDGKGWVGEIGKGSTVTEYQTHFALWCIMGSPLMMGNDLRKASPEIKNILLNKDLIAINQDKACVPATRVPGYAEVFAKPLSDGRIAFGLFNRNKDRRSLALSWDYSGWEITDSVALYDAIAHRELGVYSGSATFPVEGHGCRVIIGKRM
ncbi:MAG: glycoside hydrolase family 27 protein [Eubacteriales bacterium]